MIKILVIRPCSVDFLDGGFFSGLFSPVGRSKIKNKIKLSKLNFFPLCKIPSRLVGQKKIEKKREEKERQNTFI